MYTNPPSPPKDELTKVRIKNTRGLKVIQDLNVERFCEQMTKMTGKTPDPEVALISLHKLRCEYSRTGIFKKKYGKESGEWLVAHGYHDGIRWWIL